MQCSLRKSYKQNRFKKSAPTQNDKFKLPDRSYSVSDIQDYMDFNQQEYMEIKEKIESYLKLQQRIISNF